MPFTYILKPTAERQLEQTCADYGEEVCARLCDWLDRLVALEDAGHLGAFTMTFEEFLTKLDQEVQGDVSPLKEALSILKKKSLLNYIRGAFYLIRKRKLPWDVRISRKDIPFFFKRLDIYVVFEIDRPNELIAFHRFIGLPIDE